MTTIAFKSGVIAADSREVWTSDSGGDSFNTCEKLFRKKIGRKDYIIGTAGGSYLGMVFVDWFQGIGADVTKVPEILRDAHIEEDFDVLIVCHAGIFTANHICRPIKCLDKFVAIGSGRKAALAAMHMGANARKAVEIACKIDPYTAPPVVTMRL